MFQHTAARRRLGANPTTDFSLNVFQHTAARRRLLVGRLVQVALMKFQHTAARRRLTMPYPVACVKNVSTHSRPKAAALGYKQANFIAEFQHTAARRRLAGLTKLYAGRVGFNTQPPEGG